LKFRKFFQRLDLFLEEAAVGQRENIEHGRRGVCAPEFEGVKYSSFRIWSAPKALKDSKATN
jgi:hypothetical protein